MTQCVFLCFRYTEVMAASITHTQVRSVPSEGTYRVVDTVTVATGIAPEVFVHRTDTQAFAHVASVSDMLTYPSSRAAAQTANLAYYRSSSATIDHTLVTTAQAQAASLSASLKKLAVEYDKTVTAFVGSTTATHSS